MSRAISTIISLLITLVLLVGVGAYAYQAGVQQGAAQVAAAGDSVVTAPRWVMPMYYGYGFHPFGFGFGFLGCLAPLIVLLVVVSVFRLVRLAIWGPRWDWGHHRWHRHWAKDGVPPMFEEWHKKAHGEKPSESKK